MDYSQYGALALAYMGDCVYEIKIREFLMRQANMPVNMLHRKAKGYVSAAAQSGFADKILPLLTQEEEGVFHRGRNAKPHTTPKNMTLADYKKATGLEALFGFLYLSGNMERIDQFIEIILNEKPFD